ncbi:hypothetical protein, partial [Bacillus cereus]|uniref:hypothetical protein n=1 Tax=Bacillus cereus TaxID=1396 RepID=UPI0021122E70|nr:hypothetical protein [Bacillus cereus]
GLAKFDEDATSIKGIPLIGLGYYYKRPRVYISALIVKQTFDSSVFVQSPGGFAMNGYII